MSSFALLKDCDIRTLKLVGLGLVSSCGLSFCLLRWKRRRSMKAKAMQTRNQERLAIKRKLEDLQHGNEEERASILQLDSCSIILAAKEREIDPVQIICAYLFKACSVTQRFNSVTGLIVNAEKQAGNLKSRNAEDCLLYGLPVSLKESMQTRGMDATIGVSSFIGQPAVDDCVLAKVLKHCGAVPFVKTNLPQLMLSFGSSNPIFKNTGNPHNNNFTPGGSTSGEASLIASGGSLLGFGTDIAGSIRNPAHMCGITGLKPTMNRLSKVGVRGSLPSQTLIAATLGPMARDVDTLVLAMRALLCPLMFQLDPVVPPMPFNDNVYKSTRKLRIGFYFTDGYTEAVPACQRAVAIAKEALEKAGHILVPFKVPRIEDAVRIVTSAVYADGGQHILKTLRFSEVEKCILPEFRKWKYPGFSTLISSLIGLKWHRIGQDFSLHNGGDRSVTRLWDLQVEITNYKREFLSSWNQGPEGLDALICPPFPAPAGPQASILENMTKMMSYTALYNLLDYPGGVVPVTKVNQTDIKRLESYKGHYNDPWDRQLKKASEKSIGMPVGVQCVALPWQEEVCLRVMKEIETLVGYEQ